MLYAALGDSITAGESATSQACAYPSLVVTGLRQHRHSTVVGEVLAEPGWTSENLMQVVVANGPWVLGQAQVVSVWVGGDDLAQAALTMLHGAPGHVLARSLQRYAVHLRTLICYIQRNSRSHIIVCTQYNPFPHSAIAAQAVDALNTAIASVAGDVHVAVAPMHALFAGREAQLIAGYRTGRLQDVLTSPVMPVHPNNAGHRVIAQGLLNIIR
ncbi:MAG: SGNH/GDSL hydrolase family protein [Alicyclobacillus sp.]|nr:SGNH/GDSL hydrolase family protein [Alicyclobacillus sp.]